jgi:DNA polymerase-3 subunit epsilon
MNLRDLLALERPLIIFDTETTGPNPTTDRIVEFGFVQIRPDGEIKEYQTYVNPLMPIPHEASHGNGVDYPGHGVTNAIVEGCRNCGHSKADHDVYDIGLNPHCSSGFRPWPTFADLAPSLLKGFTDCDYGGYNIKTFDLPLMQAEFQRTGHIWTWANARLVDGYRLWQLGESRTLSDAAERFLGEKHDGAHKALDDVQVSLRVIIQQLILWPKLPRNVQDLHTMAYPVDKNALDPDNKILWKNGQAVMNFGKKWKDMPLTKMTRRDLLWIANDATGINDVAKAICKDAAMGKFPSQPGLL